MDSRHSATRVVSSTPLFTSSSKTETEICSICFKQFFSKPALRSHKKNQHNVRIFPGDSVIARNKGDLAWFYATLVSDSPVYRVFADGIESTVFEIKPESVEKSDPSIFIRPARMQKLKTQEEELESEPEDIVDDSSVTSEALSVDLSECNFPSLGSTVPQNLIVQKQFAVLPQFCTLARLRVRSSPYKNGPEVDILEKGTIIYLQKQFKDFDVDDIVNWFESCFSFSRSELIQNKAIDGSRMAEMSEADLKKRFRLSAVQAKIVHKEMRLMKRKSLFLYKNGEKTESGWISTKKKNKMKVQRVYGAEPTLELSGLFAHAEYRFGDFNRNYSLHYLVQEYMNNNKKTVDSGKQFYTFPSMDWYKDALRQFFSDAGARVRSIDWEGEWKQNYRHGTESQAVLIPDRSGKLRRRARVGYRAPDSTLFVTFSSHGNLQRFLNIDWQNQSISVNDKDQQRDIFPFHNVEMNLEKTYANECVVTY